MRAYLIPKYDSRKSFYNKAEVEISQGVTTLYSYETPVCAVQPGNVSLYPRWDSSQTTLRHVKEFLRQNGFKAETKKQISDDYA